MEFLSTLQNLPPMGIAAAGIAVCLALLLLLLGLRRRRISGSRMLAKALDRVSYDKLSHLIIPSADEGEIQLEHVLLCEQGLMIVETRDVEGVVFGSDRMHDWTVMSGDRRYTFANPQHRLYDCLAALRQLLPGAAINGCVLFTDSANFTKGVPTDVTVVSEWLQSFAKLNRKAEPASVSGHREYWQQLREAAVDIQIKRLAK